MPYQIKQHHKRGDDQDEPQSLISLRMKTYKAKHPLYKYVYLLVQPKHDHRDNGQRKHPEKPLDHKLEKGFYSAVAHLFPLKK